MMMKPHRFSLIIIPMKSIQFSARSIPLVFGVTTILAYGLLLPLTGFYWDDWPFAWIAKFLGPAAFIPAFRGFRPFLGPIFFATTSLIPPDPRLWQILALAIRFLSGLSARFALDQAWPNHKRQTLIASLLFLVFPGYSQHWVALTHINQEWIPLLFCLLSFGFTARALNQKSATAGLHPDGRRPSAFTLNTVVALLFLVVGIFPTEYFFTLEPLRFLLIWSILAGQTNAFRPRLAGALKRWWPYMLVWFADAAWLAYYYRSGAYISYGVTTAGQLPSVVGLLLAMLDAFWKAGFYAWVQLLALTSASLAAPANLLALGLVVLSSFLLSAYLGKLELPQNDARAFAVPALWIGVAGILLGRIPSLAAGLPLTLQSSFDRFMISMMLGGSLFAAGLVEFVVRSERLKLHLFALMIALGIGQQFFNANIFRRDWSRQQEIYWQMAWRMPALQENTAILTDYVPIDYETDLSFTAPINWIYAPGVQPPVLPYAMLYTVERLGGAALPDLKAGTAIQLPYRGLTFHGDTSRSVVIYAPQNGCLRVLDPAFDLATYARFPTDLVAAIPLSDPSRIRLDPGASPILPQPPFSVEPLHGWCYFYEKAELARQARDWAKVGELGAEVTDQGLSPQDVLEWFPFIEAYARTGDLKSAERITRQAWDGEAKTHRGLCALWGRVQADGPEEARGFASNLLTELGCSR
jgi:hypothetical protein